MELYMIACGHAQRFGIEPVHLRGSYYFAERLLLDAGVHQQRGEDIERVLTGALSVEGLEPYMAAVVAPAAAACA